MRTSRGRSALLAALTAATLAACGSGDGPETAEPEDGGGTYLALGDSIPFGYYDSAAGDDEAGAYVGYPDLLGEDRGLDVHNTACPGETTASFGDTAAVNHGCTNFMGQEPGFRDSSPLHVDYDGAQLAEALRVLREADDVELITLQIGANDVFMCDRTGACDSAEGREALAGEVLDNVGGILAALRGEGGYDGRIVVVGYYSSDYGDPVSLPGIEELNGALAAAAQAHGAVFADATTLFRPLAEAAGGSSEGAGLLLPDDVHPTPEGQRLLADAVEGVL